MGERYGITVVHNNGTRKPLLQGQTVREFEHRTAAENVAVRMNRAAMAQSVPWRYEPSPLASEVPK